jgi:hypothetical protein
MFWSKGSNRQASQALLAKEKDALQVSPVCHTKTLLSLSLLSLSLSLFHSSYYLQPLPKSFFIGTKRSTTVHISLSIQDL